MNRVKFLITVLSLIVCALPVLGHDTWLIPGRFSIPVGATIQLDLTSGMAFPALDTAIKPERIDRAKFRLADQTLDISKISPAAHSLRFQTELAQAGIATLWVELKPKALTLTPAKVEEYLKEIDAPESVRNRWKTSASPKQWRESYVKHAKTFLKVGNPTSDRSWAEPVGMVLEIVPERDPTALHSGDEFPVRVLKNGAPLPDFPLGLVRAGQKHGIIQKTDAEGRIVFHLKSGGKWLIRGTELRPATQPDLDWESDFTTLTFEVARKP